MSKLSKIKKILIERVLPHYGCVMKLLVVQHDAPILGNTSLLVKVQAQINYRLYFDYLPFSQFAPETEEGQVQLYALTILLQMPPFLQGPLKHSSTSGKQYIKEMTTPYAKSNCIGNPEAQSCNLTSF